MRRRRVNFALSKRGLIEILLRQRTAPKVVIGGHAVRHWTIERHALERTPPPAVRFRTDNPGISKHLTGRRIHKLDEQPRNDDDRTLRVDKRVRTRPRVNKPAARLRVNPVVAHAAEFATLKIHARLADA